MNCLISLNLRLTKSIMISIQQMTGGWLIQWRMHDDQDAEVLVTRNDVINRVKELMNPEPKESVH